VNEETLAHWGLLRQKERIVLVAELKNGQLTQQKYFLNDYCGIAKTIK
jgi:hypothetical protein